MIHSPIRLSDVITVGPQPAAGDLKKLADKGYKTIINLSKKGELGQEFKPSEEGEEVEALGMSYCHMPLSLTSVKSEDIEEFCREVGEAKSPVYVHCRIGQRSGPFSLMYYAAKRKLSPEQALKKAEKLGIRCSAPMLISMVSNFLKNKLENTEK